MAALAPQRSLVRLGILLLILAGLFYGLFEGRRLIEGPRLSLILPRDGSAVAGPLVHIRGNAQNIAFLSIDGKRSYADAAGHFDEALALPPGLAVIQVEAMDRFGRHAIAQASVDIVNFCPLKAEAVS